MKNVKTLVLVGCLVVVGLGARTVIRGREWKDSGTLILGDVNKLPDDYFLDNLAGSWYIRQEEYEKAKPYLTESVGVRAFFGNVTNLATVYMREGELMKAEDMFFWAGELGRNYRTRQNLANFLTYIKKDYEQARRVSTEGLKDYPYAGEMWLTLAVAEYEVGEIAVASEAAYRAYQLTPMGLSEAVWEQVRAGEELQLDEWLR